MWYVGLTNLASQASITRIKLEEIRATSALHNVTSTIATPYKQSWRVVKVNKPITQHKILTAQYIATSKDPVLDVSAYSWQTTAVTTTPPDPY